MSLVFLSIVALAVVSLASARQTAALARSESSARHDAETNLVRAVAAGEETEAARAKLEKALAEADKLRLDLAGSLDAVRKKHAETEAALAKLEEEKKAREVASAERDDAVRLTEEERKKVEMERAKKAEAERRERYDRYFTEVARAAKQLAKGDRVETRLALDACPVEFRDWEWHHLDLKFRDPVRAATTIPEAHRAEIAAVTFDPAGQRMATAGADGLAVIWDIATSKPARIITGHAGRVTGVAFSPDGKLLATSSVDGTARLWESTTGKEVVFPSRVQAEPSWCLAFSPDGKFLAVGHGGAGGKTKDPTAGQVRVWSIENRKVVHHFTPTAGWVYSLSFSPDAALLMGGLEDKVAILWDMKLGRESSSFREHNARVVSAVFSPDGEFAATASHDRLVRVWETKSGKLLRTCKGHSGPVTGLAFTTDGKRVLSSSGGMDLTGNRVNGEVVLWDSATGVEALTLRSSSKGMTGVAMSRTGSSLAFVSGERAIHMLTLRALEALIFQAHPEQTHALAGSPDGKLLATAGKEGLIKVWDAKTGEKVFNKKAHTGDVRSIAFDSASSRLASGGNDKVVKVFDINGDEIASLAGHPATVSAIAFSPDGKRVASGGAGLDSMSRPFVGAVHVWDLDKKREFTILRDHQTPVRAVAYSRDGKYLATGGSDGLVLLYEAETGKKVHELKGHLGVIWTLAFSPDGAVLASSGSAGSVRLWRTGDGSVIRRYQPFRAGVSALVWKPDGSRLLVAGAQPPEGGRLVVAGEVKILDAIKGGEIRNLPGHAGAVIGLVLSPDGSRLASATTNGWVRIESLAER